MSEAVRQMKDLAKRALVPPGGTKVVEGLKDEVRIFTDRWGVPHIFARTTDDLFFAEGYIHAMERLVQMEFARRLASGTLSEMVGEVTLDLDIYMRTVGLGRVAEEVARLMDKQGDEETRHIVTSYVKGVNCFIESHRDTQPFEFSVMGWQAAPWSIVDSAACGLLLTWQLSMNWGIEVLRRDLIAKLGDKRARDLMPFYPAEASAVIASQGGLPEMARNLSEQQQKAAGSFNIGIAGQAGSNNWVIDGTKSATGMPILANDPHLPIMMPSIWYEMHLVAPGLNVIGVTRPGLPQVIIGHNDRIAWGLTVLPADTQDVYVEKFKEGNPGQYLYKGNWENAEIRTELFKVAGREEPVTREVVITRHGPIMDSVLVGINLGVKKWMRDACALKWTGHDPVNGLTSLQGLVKLNQAGSWKEFREAIRLCTAFTQNVVYADVEGNIGYQASGLIPIRAKGQGLVPVPGWTGEYEWTGYIPFDEMPSSFNPPNHFIATANNKIVAEDYPYLITHDWFPPYRARRIVQLLSAKARLSPDDFKEMQGDVHSLWAEELTRFLVGLKPRGEKQKKALDYLRSWDFRVDKNSVAATIFHTWYVKLASNLLREKLGEDLYEHYFSKRLGWNCFGMLAIPKLLEYPDSYWVGDGSDSNLENRDNLVRLSLKQSIEDLTDKLGPDMTTWHWGKVHTASFRHPLGLAPPLDEVLNAGPVPMDGDEFTIVQAGYEAASGFGVLMVIPSYRQIVDLGDFSKSVSMHAPGQSGQPGSKHYRDFVKPWNEVRYHPMLFDERTIEKESKELMRLLPEK